LFCHEKFPHSLYFYCITHVELSQFNLYYLYTTFKICQKAYEKSGINTFIYYIKLSKSTMGSLFHAHLYINLVVCMLAISLTTGLLLYFGSYW